MGSFSCVAVDHAGRGDCGLAQCEAAVVCRDGTMCQHAKASGLQALRYLFEQQPVLEHAAG